MGLHHQLLACQRPTCLTPGSLSHGSRLELHFDGLPAAEMIQLTRVGAGSSGDRLRASLAGRRRIGFARRIVRILGDRGVNRFPGLRASDKNIGFRTEPCGIV